MVVSHIQTINNSFALHDDGDDVDGVDNVDNVENRA